VDPLASHPPAPRDNDTHENEERLLIERIRRGDGYAFTELVTRYLDPVTRFAFYLLGSEDAAEDVAQQVFVSVWERRETLDTVLSLKAYLFRAVRNRAFDERKAMQVRERYRASVQNEVGTGLQSGAVASPEDTILNAETIRAAMKELPERRQLVLRLRIEDELTHAEIGEILGISPQAAQVLAGRARAELRIKIGVFD
jgi:RNA polymerase sigma-70 factor (ECF subfamily)